MYIFTKNIHSIPEILLVHNENVIQQISYNTQKSVSVYQHFAAPLSQKDREREREIKNAFDFLKKTFQKLLLEINIDINSLIKQYYK